MAKRILCSGFFGFGNTGDEAILEALCQEIRRQEPDVDISVLMDNLQFAEYLGVKPYPRRSIKYILKALKSNQLLISGGGGLIQDSTGLGSVIYYLSIIAMAKIIGKPVSIVCQGFGPVRHLFSKIYCRSFLPWADISTWRDEKSLAEVKSLAPKLKSSLSADPALLLQPDSEEHISKICSQYAIKSKYIVIAMRQWPGLHIENFIESISEILSKKSDSYIVLLPFQESLDTNIAYEIAKRLENFSERVKVIKGLKPTEILGVIKGAEMVIAMRLHALIFAASQGTLAMGIAYDPKVARFCERCHIPYIPLERLEENSFTLTIKEVLKHRDEYTKKMNDVIAPMRQMARDSIAETLALIK